MTVHLRAVTFRQPDSGQRDGFPFAVPVIASLAGQRLEFPTPVVVLAGENGSGKSTLLEGLAAAAELLAAGTSETTLDPTLAPARALANSVHLVWSGARTRRGKYLRAEDFFGFARRMDTMRTARVPASA